MSDFLHCHPLLNEGSSRMSRLIKSLNPGYFQLDERTTQELIVEAHRFAQTLRFFDETNTQPEDTYWERFWEVEIITYLAVVAAKDTDELKRQYGVLEKLLKQNQPFRSGTKQVPSNHTRYLPLLENLQQLAFSLETTYQKLVRIKHPLQSLLLNRIRRDNCCDQEELEGALTKLIGFHKAANAKLPKNAYQICYAPDRHWGIKNQVEYDAIPANPHFSQNDLRDLFNTFFNTWQIIKNAAQASFEEELTRMELTEEVEYRVVQPHIVLFLVFLRLFKHAQESLNDLGAKHLDFYYEEILALKRRKEVPDEVYLLFELAKDFDQHLLEKGTLFSAGEDQNGEPILYESTEDWVLRPAQVADIKTSWIDAQCGGIHANPDVSKVYVDGIEKPNETAKNWRSMGDDRNLPEGELGFAIASPQLILREGKRYVDVLVNLNQALTEQETAQLKAEYFQIYLSSTETWIKLNPESVIAFSTEPNLNNFPTLNQGAFNTHGKDLLLHFRIILQRDDPPVVALGEKLALESGFSTPWPILKVLIDARLEKKCSDDTSIAPTSSELFELLGKLNSSKIELKVGAFGIKENLIIQSDQGVFDGTQKVFPFGPTPSQGNQFYIGSTEVFQKALTRLEAHFKWIDTPVVSFQEHYKAYNSVGYPTPNPGVQIDFIDKAEESIFKRIAKFGKIGSDQKVTGFVTDILGKPVSGVKVEALPTKNSTTTDAEGKYEISVVEITEKEEVKKADRLNFSKAQEDFENLPENIEEAARINVVLFPKKVNVKEVFSNQIKGRVTDIYGKLLDDVSIKSSSNKETKSSQTGDETDRNNNYLLKDITNNETLTIIKPNYQNIEGINFDKFTILDFMMYPEQKARKTPNTAPKNNIVSGEIFKAGTSNSPFEGVTIIAETNLVQIKTLSKGDGTYQIPLPDSKLPLKFISHDSFNPLTSKNEFDVQMFPHLHLKKIPTFDGNVSGIVTNLEKDDPIADAVIEVKNAKNEVIFSTNTTSAGLFNMRGVSEGNTIEVTKLDFISLSFTLRKCSTLNIKLAPIGVKLFENNSEKGVKDKIKIELLSAAGQPLTGANFIAEGLDGDHTVLEVGLKNNTSSHEFDVPRDSIWRITAYQDDYYTNTVEVKEGEQHKIVLTKQVRQRNPLKNNILGRVIDVKGEGISNAKISINSSKGLKSVSSDEDGEFTLPIQGKTIPFEITIDHGAFLPLVIAIDDNAELEITLVPQTGFKILKGIVTDVTNAPIDGVTYEVKNANIAKKTGKDGHYEIPIPIVVSSPQISFHAKDYEPVDLLFGEKAVTFSEADIRLYFTNLNYFKLVDTSMVPDFLVNINALNLVRDIRTQEFDQYRHTLKRGFLRFTLTDDDFRHMEYTKVLSWHVLDASKLTNITKIQDVDPPTMPNSPYTPATNSISLDYISTQIITGNENLDLNKKPIDQFFHLLPFNGHKVIPIQELSTGAGIPLLYPYLPDDTKPLNTAYTPGNLFIGIVDLQPGGSLSLLFQVAEGEVPEPEASLPDIHWSYLAANNRWLPFKTGEILKDQTDKLTRSGIIQFAIPTDAARENTMLNPELFWLRAAAITTNGKVQALPSLEHIRAQAVQVRFKNNNNEPSHLAQPLPATTIASLVESRTAIKTVEQPLESFAGRLPESMGMEYYQRISERLRHKDRAITIWDYEKMLMEQFPELSTVKCIPHTRYQPAPQASELAPGYVTLAVIPDLKKRKAEPWPEPRFTQGALNDMHEYLTAHTNLFVAAGTLDQAHLQLVNPLYEPVDLFVKVAFYPEVSDKAFHKDLLQTELTHYLSPWLANPSQVPRFGRTLERSAILQFIEERPYVDYVDVKGYQIRMIELDVAGRPITYTTVKDNATFQALSWRYIEEKICPSTARSILIAGKIVVGEIGEAKNLPPVPAKKLPPPPSPPSGGGQALKSSATKAEAASDQSKGRKSGSTKK